MSKIIRNIKPIDEHYVMPSEDDLHERTWMIWPERPDNWRARARPAQDAFATVANTIAKYEPVTMLVSKEQLPHARRLLDSGVRIMECANNDSWMRDMGPTFVRNLNGELRGVDWIFNAWGGLDGGLFFPWDLDDQIAAKTCEFLGIDRYRADFVLEGGSIHVDGEGTLFTTEECLLNPNRNPHLTKSDIEQRLKDYLGVEKVIWLPFGVYNDETNGHVDNLLHVVSPGHVLLTWTDDVNDPQYARSQAAWEVLSNSTDARNRPFKITKLHQPGPLYYTHEEVSQVECAAGMMREAGTRMPGSYANFYICNQAIILPVFNDPHDAEAVQVLRRAFPNHQIEAIYAREILLGGGNIHCITQQQPSTKKSF